MVAKIVMVAESVALKIVMVAELRLACSGLQKAKKVADGEVSGWLLNWRLADLRTSASDAPASPRLKQNK